MIAHPKVGQRVRVRYAKHYREMMPYHDCIGIVRIVAHYRPLNHGIEIGGRIIVIPCGNLMREAR